MATKSSVSSSTLKISRTLPLAIFSSPTSLALISTTTSLGMMMLVGV